MGMSDWGGKYLPPSSNFPSPVFALPPETDIKIYGAEMYSLPPILPPTAATAAIYFLTGFPSLPYPFFLQVTEGNPPRSNSRRRLRLNSRLRLSSPS